MRFFLVLRLKIPCLLPSIVSSSLGYTYTSACISLLAIWLSLVPPIYLKTVSSPSLLQSNMPDADVVDWYLPSWVTAVVDDNSSELTSATVAQNKATEPAADEVAAGVRSSGSAMFGSLLSCFTEYESLPVSAQYRDTFL
jgi:hypothetical protein